MIKLKIIGLSGGSGTGKGYVGKMFSEHGITVIDTDAVYRNLVSSGSECLSELALAFGKEIISPDGSLNRPLLAKLAFSSPERHKLLNTITHSHVLRAVREIIKKLEEDGAQAVIVDAPMLFESGFDKECDFIIGMVAPDAVRISRIMERDGISKERAEERIRVQLTSNEIEKRCDAVIYNDKDSELSSRVGELCDKILN